ncbi:RNA polymerase factor sigma-54 [Rhodovulum sp. DZ06]|uniref:RNA polymerase factor sigma-54 n=1 Tax=Rhodovulum sp. DZ06 TaxID=3425126 RepID=UPI003D33E61D
MKMGPRLELRQSQQLVMTPQLQQAIKLLQMNNLDLSAFIEAELERNPILERPAADAPADARGAGEAPVDAAEQRAAASDLADRIDRLIDDAGPEAMAAGLDRGAENAWDGDAPIRAAQDRGAGGDGGTRASGDAAITDIIADTAAAAPTLIDHLSAQIGMTRAPAKIRALAAAFAAEIDEAGYFRADLAEAAARLGASTAEGEAALALIHGCEPTGIGARDLAECLALQLAERDRLDPAMRCCLEHLDTLARADFARLARQCGVSEEDARDMAAEIRALDPRPARNFSAEPALAAPPDLLVRRAPSGAWMIELNPETLPRVLVNDSYAAELTATGGVAAKEFVAECRQNASWLVRGLESRARSMLAVGAEILLRQGAFFDEGVSALRPMTLRAVAEETGLHESTVSRVTAGKRLACERGVFDLRFFFTQAIAASDGGDAHSAESIRHRIKAMIDAEDPRKTLSDDKIVKTLKDEGVDIARRTVAKYREGMSIPSSVQRRRLKAASQAG